MERGRGTYPLVGESFRFGRWKFLEVDGGDGCTARGCARCHWTERLGMVKLVSCRLHVFHQKEAKQGKRVGAVEPGFQPWCLCSGDSSSPSSPQLPL